MKVFLLLQGAVKGPRCEVAVKGDNRTRKGSGTNSATPAHQMTIPCASCDYTDYHVVTNRGS